MCAYDCYQVTQKLTLFETFYKDRTMGTLNRIQFMIRISCQYIVIFSYISDMLKHVKHVFNRIYMDSIHNYRVTQNNSNLLWAVGENGLGAFQLVLNNFS